MDYDENLASISLFLVVLTLFFIILQVNISNNSGVLAENISAQIEAIDKK